MVVFLFGSSKAVVCEVFFLIAKISSLVMCCEVSGELILGSGRVLLLVADGVRERVPWRTHS